MLPPPVRSSTWRAHVTIPGILASVLPTRWAEFNYTTFSPYAVELACFDLRKRRDHDVTRPFADLASKTQDAIDRLIVEHYEPGRDREEGLIARIIQQTQAVAADAGTDESTSAANALPISEVVASRMNVFFPAPLREAIEQRWQELGFDGISAYLTSLARYDVMLGGPHYYFSGKDKNPELLAALDMRTLRAFHAKKRQRILFDYLVERAAGRELSDEERAAMTSKVTERLVENALRSQKAARRAG